MFQTCSHPRALVVTSVDVNHDTKQEGILNVTASGPENFQFSSIFLKYEDAYKIVIHIDHCALVRTRSGWHCILVL